MQRSFYVVTFNPSNAPCTYVLNILSKSNHRESKKNL